MEWFNDISRHPGGDEGLNERGHGQVGQFLDLDERARINVDNVPWLQLEIGLLRVQNGVGIDGELFRIIERAAHDEHARFVGAVGVPAARGNRPDNGQIRSKSDSARQAYFSYDIDLFGIRRRKVHVVTGFDRNILGEVALLEEPFKVQRKSFSTSDQKASLEIGELNPVAIHRSE